MSLDTVMVAGCSDAHTRAENQDRLYPAADKLPATLSLPHNFAVADGMGGTQDGAAAAERAVASLDALQQRNDPTREIIQHFQTANQIIIQELGGPAKSGSTLSLLALRPKGFNIGHIGDSRIYLWREQCLYQLTEDHNIYAERRASGHVPFFPNQLQLTVDDRLFLEEHKLAESEFYYKVGRQEALSELPQVALLHVGQQVAGRFEEQLQLGKIIPVQKDKDRLALALGKQTELPVEALIPTPPQGLVKAPQKGDLYLLCTDGLCGSLTNEQIGARMQQIAQLYANAQTLDLLHWGSQQLFDDAAQAGSSDNITLMLLAIPGTTSESSTEAKDTQPISAAVQTEEYPTQALVPEHTEALTPAPLPAAPTTGILNQDLQPQTPLPVKIAVTQGSVFGTPTTDVEAPPKQDTERQYKATIGGLALLVAILAVALWKTASPQTPSSPPKQRTETRPLAKERALFWMPLPQLNDAPSFQQRIKWLQRLYQQASWLQYQWGLNATQLAPLNKALQDDTVSHRAFVALWHKVPREAQDLAPFDAGLQQATSALWQLIAPTYQKYLDEMNGTLAFPMQVDKASRSKYRKQRLMLLRWWEREAGDLLAKDWRTSLLKERLLTHPRRSSTASTTKRRAQLRRCIRLLRHAHAQLTAQSPSHPLLRPLHNRLQLHQAHIEQIAAPTPKP